MEPHVVIVGGGFGGLYAAKRLAKEPVRVTLVDRRNHHLFQPLLYQVATAGLSPGNIAAPLRAILRGYANVHVLLGEMRDLDAKENTILLADGTKISYDYLIIATGASHSYFGNEQWAANAPGLKTLEDALEMRRRVLLAYERAERSQDAAERDALLTFVVIGGGPTGLELAGALGEMAHLTLRGNFRSIDPADAKILLIEAADRVLPPYPPELSAKAQISLERLGVTVMTQTKVIDVDDRQVTVQVGDGTKVIPTYTVLWGAGVQASPLGKVLQAKTGVELDRVGRVMVESDLSVAGFQISMSSAIWHTLPMPLRDRCQVWPPSPCRRVAMWLKRLRCACVGNPPPYFGITIKGAWQQLAEPQLWHKSGGGT